MEYLSRAENAKVNYKAVWSLSAPPWKNFSAFFMPKVFTSLKLDGRGSTIKL
jgi:hypothetical protein